MAVSSVPLWSTSSAPAAIGRVIFADRISFMAISARNLTVEGLADDEVCIGDRFRIGGASAGTLDAGWDALAETKFAWSQLRYRKRRMTAKIVGRWCLWAKRESREDRDD
jgi:hypothetical protein